MDLRPSRNVLVNVNVSLDPATHQLTWSFGAIDPATGRAPTNPLDGFLPPNVTPPEGEGSVLFTVKPRPVLPTGAQIRNNATITFDGAAQVTPDWLNIAGNPPPSSHVLPLAVHSDQRTINVQWMADDSPPDLRDFTIYVSEDGGAYRWWRQNTTATADTLRPPADHHPHSYAFYSVARDMAGNIEAPPPGPDATTLSRTAVREASSFALGLEGARPNPALRVPRVWFVLPSGEAATLELIDVAGRRVARREVGALGPGRHAVTLGTARELAPGLYFVRLAQGGQALNSLVAVIR
jgi:hypothetical protein